MPATAGSSLTRQRPVRKWRPLVVALTLLAVLPAAAAAAPPAAFTTVNPGVDGTGKCLNGSGLVNCNIYAGKEFVWLNGGPAGIVGAEGDYFFTVTEPSGAAGPDDGAAGNLSDGANGTVASRSFHVDANGVVTVGAGFSHDLDPATNKIRLAPYDDTSNPGGVYKLWICKTANHSDCKTDNFKVKADDSVPPAANLTISKTAIPTFDRTYGWSIKKSVNKTRDENATGNSSFDYSVTVTRDAGTDGNYEVAGVITVGNPNLFNVSGVDVTDKVDNGGTCVVTDGTDATIPGTGSVDFNYVCTYGTPDPLAGINTASADYDEGGLKHITTDVGFDFTTTDPNEIDACVDVTDTYGDLGNVCETTSFPYTKTFEDDPAGTCTSHKNTAAFTAGDTGATDDDSVTVQVCVGADPTVSKTADPAFKRTYHWGITKDVDKTLVKQVSGTTQFNYTVKAKQSGIQDSDWVVNGKITVANPTDWEAIEVDVSDAVDNGGTCTVTGGTDVVVPASGSKVLDYTCTWAAAPTAASGINTATGTWDAAVAHTPNGSDTGTANFTFGTPTTTVNKTIHVTDSYAGALGTVTGTDAAPFNTATFTYSRSVPVLANQCKDYPNTATITETGQSASKSVRVCGAVLGGHTIGFWQNKNGQALITGEAKTGTCPSVAYLRTWAPFQDLSATATCAQVATYVTNIIKAASSGGAAMNAMLKAQMLATALSARLNDPALGGRTVDTSAYSGAFGGQSSMTVLGALNYAASQSNPGGSVWYAQVKATQELAKNLFDAINNEVAFAA